MTSENWRLHIKCIQKNTKNNMHLHVQVYITVIDVVHSTLKSWAFSYKWPWHQHVMTSQEIKAHVILYTCDDVIHDDVRSIVMTLNVMTYHLVTSSQACMTSITITHHTWWQLKWWRTIKRDDVTPVQMLLLRKTWAARFCRRIRRNRLCREEPPTAAESKKC